MDQLTSLLCGGASDYRALNLVFVFFSRHNYLESKINNYVNKISTKIKFFLSLKNLLKLVLCNVKKFYARSDRTNNV